MRSHFAASMVRRSRSKKVRLVKLKPVCSHTLRLVPAANAFEWLERAYQERSSFMPLLKFETVLDNLRADPRYKDLLKRMNLPE